MKQFCCLSKLLIIVKCVQFYSIKYTCNGVKAGVVDLHPGELQTAIIIPKKSYEGYAGHYIKYAMRNAMDIATIGCSVNVKLSADKKTIENARIAYGVAGPIPMRAPSAEKKSGPKTSHRRNDPGIRGCRIGGHPSARQLEGFQGISAAYRSRSR